MIGVILTAMLCASSVRLGPEVVDLMWVRPAGTQRLARLAAPAAPIVAPDGSAAAVFDRAVLHVLPGNARIDRARAAAFSPDGKRLAVALSSGRIVEGKTREKLGRMAGVERLAWATNVIAAGKSGALLLPDVWLTREPVRNLLARGDRIALATGSEVLLFDGEGQPLRRIKTRASALALSPGGKLAWAAGRTVRMLDAEQPMAREHDRIEQLAFDGERLNWVAGGGRRWDGASLDCAHFLDGTRGLLATCPRRVVDWDEAERTVYAMPDCAARLAWAVPLGDGLLLAVVLRDRRFTVPCKDRF